VPTRRTIVQRNLASSTLLQPLLQLFTAARRSAREAALYVRTRPSTLFSSPSNSLSMLIKQYAVRQHLAHSPTIQQAEQQKNIHINKYSIIHNYLPALSLEPELSLQRAACRPVHKYCWRLETQIPIINPLRSILTAPAPASAKTLTC